VGSVADMSRKFVPHNMRVDGLIALGRLNCRHSKGRWRPRGVVGAPHAGQPEFQRPRGLRFREGGRLYCVALDEVVAFDFNTGKCLGAVVHLARLNGQALAFFP